MASSAIWELPKPKESTSESPEGIFPTVWIIEIQRDIDEMVALLEAEGLKIKGVYDLQNPDREEIVFTDHDGYRVLLMRLDRPE